MSETQQSTLWRIPFTPHAPKDQAFAARIIKDTKSIGRHKYWEVECLQESLRTQSFSDILKEISQDTHPDSIILHDALKEDFALLQNWDVEKEPQKMLVLWRDRAITENWNDVVEEVDSVLFDARWSSLQRICSLSKNESDFGFDPNRIGLITTSNGKYLLDIDTNLTRVWDAQTGNAMTSWEPPSPIRSAAALFDDVVAIGLEDGSLYHWELGEDTQYQVYKSETGIAVISAQEETCAIFTVQEAQIINDDGICTHNIPFSSDDPPSLFLTPDKKRLIISNPDQLLVWNLESNTELYSLTAPEDVDEDVEMMTTAILDMASQSKGQRLMDAVSIWDLSLEKQYQLLQTLSEPMVLSPDCERMVSFENGVLQLWERREGRHYVCIHNEKLANIWGLNTIISLAHDCSLLAAAVPDGLIAWDFNTNQFSSLPLPFTFTTTLHSIPNTRFLAVDTGQSVSLFRFASL